MRTLSALVGGIAVGSVLTCASMIAGTPHVEPVLATTVSDSTTNDPVVPWFAKRPCAEEDSVNCSWNASQSGNGVGHSFIVRRLPGQDLTCVLYEKRRFARHNDYCVPGQAGSR